MIDLRIRVDGGHVQMKDLNRVLLVLLSDATIGPVSSGRQYKCQSTFFENRASDAVCHTATASAHRLTVPGPLG